jgi:hypothetical protein
VSAAGNLTPSEVPYDPISLEGYGPAFSPVSPRGLPSGAQLIGPGMVDAIGNAYGPVISNLQQQQDAARRAASRNADEARGWYRQVVNHLGRAAVRDKEINQAAVGSMEDATQAIVGSLGGAANEGSGMVAAAGNQAVGTLGALGSVQEQYNADMAPLLEGEGAGMAARISSRGAKNAADLAARIAEVQAQQSAARSEAMMNIAQINNEIRNGRYDRSFQLRQYNDQLLQNAFNNNVTMAQLIAASQAMGQKIAGRQRSGSYPWAKAPQTVRNAAVQQIQTGIKGAASYPEAVASANAIIRGYGWSLKNPAVLALRNQLLADAGYKTDPRTK